MKRDEKGRDVRGMDEGQGGLALTKVFQFQMKETIGGPDIKSVRCKEESFALASNPNSISQLSLIYLGCICMPCFQNRQRRSRL